MKKYSTAVDNILLKATDFSIVNNKIYFKNEREFWIYTVPSNTIAKLLSIDCQIPNAKIPMVSSGNSLKQIFSRLYMKRPDGLIVPMKTISSGLNDVSNNHYYFNEGWSIGFVLNSIDFEPNQQLSQDAYVTLYFMIEYDSYSEEISERLDSLSSRVTYLENIINSK